MSSPLVTILVPTFGRSNLLPDAIRSAVSQTHFEIEVVILDDASPDGGRTTEVVQPFLKCDERIRYFRNHENLGIAKNWQKGIAAASGKYFCLLHDDDTFEPTFVSELTTILEQDASLVIAFCDHWVADVSGTRNSLATEVTTRTFGRERLSSGRITNFSRSALVDTSIPIGATLFRRDNVTPELIDDRAKGSVDMWLLYGCVRTGMGAAYLPHRLMNYRSHSGGLSASQPLYMSEGHLWRYERMLDDPNLSAIHAELMKMRSATQIDYGVQLVSAGRSAEAARALVGIPGQKAAIGRLLAGAGLLGTASLNLARHISAACRTSWKM